MTEDIKTLSESDLQKHYTEKREALRGMRFNVAGSKIKNVREQSATKKDIARILTEVNKRKNEHGK
jgi:ribosomal protein L29